MFETGNSVGVGRRSDGDDQLVICSRVPTHLVVSAHRPRHTPRYLDRRRRLTRHVTSLLVSLIVLEDLDLEQPFRHVHIHGPAGHVVSTDPGDDLAERLDEGTGFDGSYACAANGKSRTGNVVEGGGSGRDQFSCSGAYDARSREGLRRQERSEEVKVVRRDEGDVELSDGQVLEHPDSLCEEDPGWKDDQLDSPLFLKIRNPSKHGPDRLTPQPPPTMTR